MVKNYQFSFSFRRIFFEPWVLKSRPPDTLKLNVISSTFKMVSARILLLFLAALILTTLAAPAEDADKVSESSSAESDEASGTMEQDYYGNPEDYEYDGM